MAFIPTRFRASGTTAMLALSAAVYGGVVLGAPKPPAKLDPWRVVSTADAKADQEPMATIRFVNGHVLTLRLYHAAVIGTLPSSGATPYLVVDGVECSECDATARSVYVGDVGGWPRDFSKDGWAAGYPSRNYSVTKGKLMSWSRLFIGRCVGENPGVISFYSAREEKGWSRRTSWVEVVGARLVAHAATSVGKGVPKLATVAKSVRGGRCREVHAQKTDEGDYG